MNKRAGKAKPLHKRARSLKDVGLLADKALL